MTDILPHWYCLSAKGHAQLCDDQPSAIQRAKWFDWDFPESAPHTAVQLAPAPAQGKTKTKGEILQLLRDIEANVQRAWKDGSLSAKAWPADIGRRLSDVVNAKCAEIAQGADGVEALAARLEAHADAHASVSPHNDEQATP